jgi:hypothetical protein
MARRQSVPSPMSSPQASQRPSTSWKRHCFVASEKDRAAVRRNGFQAPCPAEVLLHRAFLPPSLPPSPQATDRSIPSVTATLQVFGDNSRCNMVYCRVRRQNASKRKLKPLPLEPFRHQDSVIARSEPCQAPTISARRHSPTRLRITASDPKPVVHVGRGAWHSYRLRAT